MKGRASGGHTFRRTLPRNLLSDWPALALLALSLAAGTWAYPRLPARVPIHWDVRGRPDGFGSAVFAAFFPTFLAVAVFALMTILPAVDPRRENYAGFAGFYRWLKFLIVGVIVLVHLVSLGYGLGYPVSVDRVVAAAVSLLLLFIGSGMGTLRHNYFVGIRTPWTLADERVWRDTHRSCAYAWMGAGLVGLGGSFFGGIVAFAVLLGGVLAATGFSLVYSYYSFRRWHGRRERLSR
ncbi:MAG: SdpI family protein [Clostridia bacterium]|nr:SdpI family protein [Clostridia bacterium]